MRNDSNAECGAWNRPRRRDTNVLERRTLNCKLRTPNFASHRLSTVNHQPSTPSAAAPLQLRILLHPRDEDIVQFLGRVIAGELELGLQRGHFHEPREVAPGPHGND